MKNSIAIALILIFVSIASAGEPLKVAPSVDFSRYAGKWYEIARLPNRFERNCAGDVTAEYSDAGGGNLKIINRCLRTDGTIDRADGAAERADERAPNSKLRVRFAPDWLAWLPFVWGDYWIIEVDEGYGYSLVGTPDRKYLWILARTPEIEDVLYRKLADTAQQAGFDTARLIKTPQSGITSKRLPSQP